MKLVTQVVPDADRYAALESRPCRPRVFGIVRVAAGDFFATNKEDGPGRNNGGRLRHRAKTPPGRNVNNAGTLQSGHRLEFIHSSLSASAEVAVHCEKCPGSI